MGSCGALAAAGGVGAREAAGEGDRARTQVSDEQLLSCSVGHERRTLELDTRGQECAGPKANCADRGVPQNPGRCDRSSTSLRAETRTRSVCER